jgi:hypothetical protein
VAGRILVTPPALEPVAVADAKVFARVDPGTTTEDALLGDLIVAARKVLEDWRGQSFLTQTWDYFVDQFPRWYDGYTIDGAFTPIGAHFWTGYPQGVFGRRELPIVLPRPPLQSVTWVKYLPFNAGGVWSTMDPTTYQVDTQNILAPRVSPNFDKLWPADLLQAVNGVNVRFVAGYLPDVPEQITLAIKQLVAFWFNNRDAVGTIPDGIFQTLETVTGGFTYA